jgi:ferredoxin-NADP reductase
MTNYPVEVLDIRSLTHNVRSFTVAKPDGFTYTPGQATELSLLTDKWKYEKRPFTFTSLPDDDSLEFTIKSYTDHDGVTKQLGKIESGETLEIGDAWGTIEYKGEGVFLAGGAGITPFIAIFRNLAKRGQLGNNRLIFANKTGRDIILKEEFEHLLGNNYMNILSGENIPGSFYGRIDKAFLQKHILDFNQPFYVCGPDGFTSSLLEVLEELGAKPDTLVFEK